jgi:metal-dependent amidase/aminoacylase/carboxypeptidase family protein
VISDQRLLEAIEAASPAGLEVMRFVHSHPELGHEEYECSALLAERLRAAGLAVEVGVGGMETAFRATLEGAGPGRTVGLVCLYDAVAAVRPHGALEAVHSCGHGPIAGGVTLALLALADCRDALSGKVVVIGCPSDEIHAPGTAERGGGKAISADAGLWEGVDAALYAHPEFIDTVSLGSRWMRRERVRVAGQRSLTGDPEPPLAVGLAVLGANAHDVMVERMQLDGDVEEATGLVLRADVLVFADSSEELEARCRALRAVVPGADWISGRTVEGVRPDETVTAVVADAFRALSREFVADPPPLPFATDFGNISRRVPGALVGIGHEGGWAFHTDEGASQFASREGEEAARTIAGVLALAAARLTEPA